MPEVGEVTEDGLLPSGHVTGASRGAEHTRQGLVAAAGTGTLACVGASRFDHLCLSSLSGLIWERGRRRIPNTGGHLLSLRWSCHCLLTLAGGARWCVLDGSAALRRSALAGVGIRALAGLGLLLPPGGFSGKCPPFCCGCGFPVDLLGTDKSILLVARDNDDTYWAWHFQYIVRIVRGCHDLGECRTAKDSIVR